MKCCYRRSLRLFLSILSLIFFLLLILPIFLVLFLLCYAWRLLLIRCIGFVSPRRFVRIMDGKNPVMAIDDLYSKPLSTIVGMGAFDGDLNFERASSFVSNVVNAKDASGKLVNPEFHQYYEEWGGFMWWKEEINFCLNEHLKLWDTSQFTNGVAEEKDVIKIIGHLERIPFPKEKSPWEVIVLPNVNLRRVQDEDKNKTLLIFRFHHGLADGIAVMQLFMKYVFDDAFEKVAHPVYTKRSRFQAQVYRVLALLSLPYEFFKQGIVAYDVNPWHLPESKLKRDVSKAWSQRISIKSIKTTKQIYGVGFTAVLISAITGAIRTAMIANKVKVPKKMHAILPLPWPGHPQKLCNHWSYGFISLPVGTENRVQRLKKCEKYVTKLKQSPSPAINFGILTVFNLLPTWIIRKATLTNYFPTVILSNFPGPPSGTTGIGGFPLVDTCFTGGPLRGSIGISITILSYDGALRIVAGVDRAIFPSDEMTQSLIASIQKEFDSLQDFHNENETVV